MRCFPVILLFLGAALAGLSAQEIATADPAARGDRFFAGGELKQAIAAYRTALEGETDRTPSPGTAAAAAHDRNRFLVACLLFELRSFEKAKTEFETLHAANENARASGMFAQLCARRMANPEESIGESVDAVIVPFLEDVNGRSGAWNDPVIEGLMGEAMLRSGPMHLSPTTVGPFIEENPDDPEILLGAAQFLGRSQRSGLLDIARRKFPKSPAIQVAAFHSLQFTRNPAIRGKAMETLGAVILADPDNAYPRYLRIGIEHYVTRRDPATGTLPPYPAEIVADLEHCNRLTRFEAYTGERIAAARRVLRELGHPFQLSLVQSNVESGLVLNNLLQRLTAGAKAALDAGDFETAAEIQRITGTVIDRWNAHTGSSAIRNMTAANASNMLAHFAQYNELRGNLDQAEEIRSRQREHQARVREGAANVLWPSIAIVPIPAISNLAVERILTGAREEKQ